MTMSATTTTNVTGTSLVASTGFGGGRWKSFAHARLMPSHSATATCPPSSGSSGIRLKTNSAMFSDARETEHSRDAVEDRRVGRGDLAGEDARARRR